MNASRVIEEHPERAIMIILKLIELSGRRGDAVEHAARWNDPDGRSRLNVNIFTGDVIVTDFGDTPSLGNILKDRLVDAYDGWLQTSSQSLNCHCSSVQCLGPNVLVKNRYYPSIDFQDKKSLI